VAVSIASNGVSTAVGTNGNTGINTGVNNGGTGIGIKGIDIRNTGTSTGVNIDTNATALKMYVNVSVPGTEVSTKV
jgi:hypothetical protein